jgi:uncharacterized protein YmfQ (DUF2313 family)
VKTLTLNLITAACMAVSGVAMAQDTRPAAPSGADRMKTWTNEKDALEKMLGTGKDKAYYRSELEKAGYWITAINADTPARLEYEIVKGANTYEVQVNFADGRSTKVDVTTNVWKDAKTKEAMAGRTTKYIYPTAVTKDADKVSDSVRNKAWMDEKGKMEKELGIGHDRAYYKPALEKMGFKVTSVNENDKKNLEYEVVRGDTTYEVQVDFDATTAKSTRVGVSTNMWEAPATERAKGDK